MIKSTWAEGACHFVALLLEVELQTFRQRDFVFDNENSHGWEPLVAKTQAAGWKGE